MTPGARVLAHVRALRRGRGWSQAQLAERMAAAGVPWDRIVVTRIETGRREGISVDEMYALASVFNVEPHSLTTARVRITCPRCDGAPPAGFRCTACGTEA